MQLPRTGKAADVIRHALSYAVLAPSSHNSQPWLFRVGEPWVELHADKNRWLRVCDPAQREMTISCGAALAHLELALRCFRLRPHTHVFPGGNENIMARVEVERGSGPSPEDDRLLHAVPHRRTGRRPFDDRPVSESLLVLLRQVAVQKGLWLEFITSDDGRTSVADLASQGDKILASDPAYRKELSSWLRPNLGRHRDGIPGSTTGLWLVASYLAPLLVRYVNWGKHQAARDRRLVLESPVLMVLGSESDDAAHWLAAGQALARLLLMAATQDVVAGYFSQVIQVPELRVGLRDLLRRSDYPQLLMRLGYSSRRLAPTPRRPAGEVQLLSATYRASRPGTAAPVK